MRTMANQNSAGGVSFSTPCGEVSFVDGFRSRHVTLSCPGDAYFVYESCPMRDQTKLTCFFLCLIKLESEILRPFLTQSDLSVENGCFRLKPKSIFLTQSKKGLFDSTFFLTEFFRLGDSVDKLEFFDRICRSKNSVEKVLHLFFKPMASLISPQNTHPHAHTPIPGTTQQYHTTAQTLPWLSLLLLLAASQCGALLAPLASSVYHTTAVARVIDAILPTTATPAAALSALG